MRDILKSKIFWTFSAAFAMIIFVVVINSGRTYKVEVDILLLPKNETMVRNISQIIENVRQIPLSLSFYNKIIENNSDIEDAAFELPDAKRKQFWNAQIETSQIGKSGLIKIAIFNASPLQTEMISRQAISSLSVATSQYYNIKTDLDMRIVDGPIVSQVARINIPLWIFISLVAGIFLGLVIFLGSNLFSKKFAQDAVMPSSMPRPFMFPDFPMSQVKEKKAEIDFGTQNIFDFKIEDEAAIASAPIKKKEVPMAQEKKASAPSNLPIAEEEFVFALPMEVEQPMVKEEEVETFVAEKKTEPVDTTREATLEEVKARLNKLLGGDIL